MDYRLALMTGIDIPIEEFQVNIHQPTIKEISYIGEEETFNALQYLTIDKNNCQIPEEALKEVSNFSLFITLVNSEKGIQQRKVINNLLFLLFPSYKTIITPQSIVLSKTDGTLIIDENNFYLLQEILKQIFCLNSQTGSNADLNPSNKKAKEIAEKIMEGRKRISKEKGEGKQSIFSRYLSILSIGNHQSLNDLINLTVYQINDLLERYQLFVNWDIDLKCKLAGAEKTDQVEDWRKNIH